MKLGVGRPGCPRAPRIARAAAFLALLGAIAGCGRRQPPAPVPKVSTTPAIRVPAAPAESTPAGSTRAESAAAILPAPESAAALPSPALRYLAFPITGQRSLTALADSLGPRAFADVLKLNRRDLAHIRDRDTLVVPAAADSFLALSPFPETLPAADSLPKLIVVSRAVQAVAAYQRGHLVRWAPTSTGRKDSPTPEGMLHTNWRERERNSTFNDEWHLEWYLNLENWSGVSMHQYELPGRPASHACVRLMADDAEWFFRWADTWSLSADRRHVTKEGTPVLVFGDWSYGQRPPWKRLPVDPGATRVSREEIEAAMAKFMSGRAP